MDRMKDSGSFGCSSILRGATKNDSWFCHESFLYPHAESNRNRQNRNLKFYPLNYRAFYLKIKHLHKLMKELIFKIVKHMLNTRVSAAI